LVLGTDGSVRAPPAEGSAPVSPRLARERLGEDAFSFLEPYLTYTRATAEDLRHVATGRALPSLRRAEACCGPERLRDIIGEIGWPRLNLGLEVRHCVAVSVGGSLPFVLPRAEAALLERCPGARRVGESWLAIAHGAAAPEAGAAADGTFDDRVARFRDYNLAHAELLARFLAPGPLTRERAAEILARMERLVEEFVALFGTRADDDRALPGAFQELAREVQAGLDRETGELTSELTRRVLAFEDPPACGRAGSLHGLKRWLHQRGLRLGFKLMRGGRAADRTVDLLLLPPGAAPRAARRVRYADLDPFDDDASAILRLPYPVAAAVEGFSRQLLCGEEKLPHVDIFCYRSEVHYFLSFWNHPALLRVNFAPPLRGGMIDLEYYGVSNYEADVHPNLHLDALQELFRRLDFDVAVDTTRVLARFDKERALDVEQLRHKTEAVLGLAPHLMDLDWTVGSLALDAGARRRVAEAWAERFALWGVLPVSRMLTRDRRGILTGLEAGPSGERELVWSGFAPYRDRFGPPPEAQVLAGLFDELEALGVEILPLDEAERHRPIGQLALERRALLPLRAAVERGAVTLDGAAGPRAIPDALHRPQHEAERFAAMLLEGGAEFAASARLARLVPALERSLRFVTTGTVNGHRVQRARLPLRGATLGLFVLRGERGVARLALFARDETLHLRRDAVGRPWQSNARSDAAELVALLRRGEYLASDDERLLDAGGEGDGALRRRLIAEPAAARPLPLPGERTVRGVEAAPGRVVGWARLDPRHRSPREVADAVLVAPTIGPEDSAHLWHCAGVVSTGGGALSHAGLIATQFGKPALIVAGRWERHEGRTELVLAIPEYREEERRVATLQLRLRRRVREREHRLREGDLVVLDAGQGTLEVLGQAPETRELHEEFRTLEDATRRLATATDDADVLALRGRRLRARRAIARSLERLTDAVLVRHAVHELLPGRPSAAGGEAADERAELLAAALKNPHAGGAAAAHARWAFAALERRRDAALARAARRLPSSAAPFEILWTRAQVLDFGAALAGARRALERCRLLGPAPPTAVEPDVEALAVSRLCELRDGLALEAERAASPGPPDPRLPHLLRRLGRIDRLLGRPANARLERLRERLEREAEAERRRLAERRTLGAEESGAAVVSLVGWKAANLAELARLDEASSVPPWFVVTDRAFRDALGCAVEGPGPGPGRIPGEARTIGAAIDTVLERTDLGDAEKSALILALWERLPLPAALAAEIVERYLALGSTAGPDEHRDAGPPFVAVRSSSVEEDAEAAVRAGEFDTFLFVRGADDLIAHVKRAWAGLWTARAIHNRAVLGFPHAPTGGGVVVQRIVWPGAAGVLQTVNLARGEPLEIVINVGLGLGEGVVRGTVAVDVFTVAKDDEPDGGALRMRCVTGEKTQKVVFNRTAGRGTIQVDTRHHERLRPALEHAELRELVRAARRLEEAYGHPLDIEFAVEAGRLWILQVRPVSAWLGLLRDAVERRPLQVEDVEP
jgi:hypothetical protein